MKIKFLIKACAVESLILLFLAGCGRTSGDRDEDLTPLREGQTIGTGNLVRYDNFGGISADGTRLVYVSGKLITYDTGGQAQEHLRVYGVQIQDQAPKETRWISGDLGDEQEAAISPNGAWVAARVEGEDGSQLVLGDFAGDAEPLALELSIHSAMHFAFSADSSILAVSGKDADGADQIQVLSLPADSTGLSADLNPGTFEGLTQTPQVLKFVPHPSAGSYRLVYDGTENLLPGLKHLDFSAPDALPEEDAVLIQGELEFDASLLASDSDEILSVEAASDRTPIYTPVFEVTGDSSALVQTLALDTSLRRNALSGESQSEEADFGKLGFSLRGFSTSSAADLFAGVFNEAYYCDASKGVIKTASTLKTLALANPDAAKRMILSEAADGNLSVSTSFCVAPEGTTLLLAGLSDVQMNSEALASAYTAVITSQHRGDRELYLMFPDGDSVKFVKLSKNTD